MKKIRPCSDNMGVSKNRGKTPKWMIYHGNPWLKWMIWGETHHLMKHPYQPCRAFPQFLSTVRLSKSTHLGVTGTQSWTDYTHATLQSPNDLYFFKITTPKKRPFPIETRVIWVPSMYIIVHQISKMITHDPLSVHGYRNPTFIKIREDTAPCI